MIIGYRNETKRQHFWEIREIFIVLSTLFLCNINLSENVHFVDIVQNIPDISANVRFMSKTCICH